MKIIKVAIYLALLMCAACNLSQQQTSIITPTVDIAPTNASIPTAETSLTTYSNTAYGYSIQYPEGLALEGASDSQYVWLDRQIYMYVSEVDPEKPMGDAPVIEQAQNTMIGAYTARHLNGYIGAVGGSTPQRYESFVITHNNRYYQFIAYELKRDNVQPIDRTMGAVPADALALLTQIVTSLRFTN